MIKTTFELFDYEKQQWREIKVNEISQFLLEGYIIDSVTAYEDDTYRIRLRNERVFEVLDNRGFDFND